MIAQELATNLSADEALNLTDRLLNYFKSCDTKKRLGRYIEEIGMDTLKAKVLIQWKRHDNLDKKEVCRNSLVILDDNPLATFIMEIPAIPDNEKQKIFTQMWVGQMLGVIGFIMQKLGPQAMKSDNPMSFAMGNAVVNKNIFGSDVDVLVNKDGSVTLDIKRCSNLAVALEFASKGVPATKEHYCDGCMNGYFRKVAEKLGLKFSGGYTEEGCKMTVAK